MPISPISGKLITMSILFIGWMAAFERSKRLDPNKPYHVASDQRDRKKARFYFNSVWVGLVTAFLSFVALDTLSAFNFDSSFTREWVTGLVRSAGVWGLTITLAVWLQVGQRVTQPNSDGKSLMPLREQNDRKF